MSTKPVLRNSLRLNSPYPVINTSAGDRDLSEHASIQHSLKILEPFDQSQYETLLKASRGGHTGQEWIRDVAAYKTWIEHEDHVPLQEIRHGLRLSVSGGPEVGKTSLALFIIDELKSFSARSDTNIQVLYFFCHLPDRNYNSASAILKGLFLQLVQQRPDLTTEFCDWLCAYDSRSKYLYNPTALWDMFRSALKGDDAGTTYCMIDGLHECDADSARTIEQLITRPFPFEGCLENEPRLKVMITSRSAIASSHFGKVELNEQNTGGSDTPNQKLTKINGYLRDLDTKRGTCLHTLDVIAAYRHPPTTALLQSYFNESYEDIEMRVQLCQPFIRTDRAQGLQFNTTDFWLRFSNPNRNAAQAIHKKLAQICLSVIDRKISQIDMEELERGTSMELPADVRYAVLFWADHVRLSQDATNGLLYCITATFSRNSTNLEKWWIIYLQEYFSISQQDTWRQHHTTVLHLVALFGLHRILQTAVISGRWPRLVNYLDMKDCLGMDPLSVAVSQKHAEIAELLVSNGTGVTFTHCVIAAGSNLQLARLVFRTYVETEHRRTPQGPQRIDIVDALQRAVVSGDERLVSCTIKFLQDVSPRSFPWNEIDSLMYVINSGQRHLLTPLLAITNLETTAEELIEFAAEEHEEVILADLMAMPKIRSIIEKQKLTLVKPLNLALTYKCPLMVDRLMSDRNVAYEDDHYRTPFQVATRFANHQTLCRFLQHPKFLFNRGSVEEGVALNVLLHKDKIDNELPLINLRQILERGARMRYQHFGITALHVAAELGRAPVMEVLLEKMSEKEIKADIDRQPSSRHGHDRDDKTALAIAAVKGHYEIVRLLLLRGADMDIKDRLGNTVTELAEAEGHAEIVQLLEKVKRRGVAAAREVRKGEADGASREDGLEEQNDTEEEKGGGRSRRKGKGKARQ
ncbi:ankyrin [Cucurbitaria berberidis CBS 394.84]|uniref:Ankyrin n=1 Tax=Cucurbitaria berberidis CBS 394.84 TaxID=1168544 RepID=A0A9P4GLM9_9PLEO|nr:ankyrin [Cucurbitaria berberidis CBS 394.84]KAF1848623.1 ankyrin [Cucurbitaria berberidis CBS 394.84]